MRSSAMPILLRFNQKTKQCVMIFNDRPVDSTTIIYVPNHIHYLNGFEVYVTNNNVQFDKENKILLWRLDENSIEHQIILCLKDKFDESNLPVESLKLFRKMKHYKLDFGPVL